MPYIKPNSRELFDYLILELAIRLAHDKDNVAGNFNYSITRMVDIIIKQNGLNYANLNELIGSLECIKLELYRRVASPYEDEKILENGDVYSV